MMSVCDCELLSFTSSGTLLGVNVGPVICRFCWKKWAAPHPYGRRNVVVSVEGVDLVLSSRIYIKVLLLVAWLVQGPVHVRV